MAQEFRWITFSLDGKEILAMTVYGVSPGEIKATVEQLAYEKGVPTSEIVVGRR